MVRVGKAKGLKYFRFLSIFTICPDNHVGSLAQILKTPCRNSLASMKTLELGRALSGLSTICLCSATLFGGLQLPASARKTPEPADSVVGISPVFRNAWQVHTMTSEEAAKGYPVHFIARVTYYDPYIDFRHGAVFVCDRSGCIFAALPAKPILQLAAGTVVELSGITAAGDFAPMVDKAEVRILGQQQLPERAVRATRSQLLTGALDGQWVEVEGLVHSVDKSGRNALWPFR